MKGLALLLTATLAGTAGAATLSLRVLDAAGQPVPDVAVVVISRAHAQVAAPLPPVEIVQEKMRYQPALSIVTPGTRVRFTNRDPWDHHVRATEAQSFEFRIGGARPEGPGAPREQVIQGGPGPINLGCFIHSRMQAAIYVSESPWFGISRADGSVALPELPEGPLEVAVWHPQQLVEQPRLKLASAAQAPAALNLNFVPRRR